MENKVCSKCQILRANLPAERKIKMNTGKELQNLFDDLQMNAYNSDYHTYYYKDANQIIRKHFERLEKQVKVGAEVKPEICARISKINSGGGYIDSERLSKYFTDYNLIPQEGTKINLVSEDRQYLEQFDVIQIYYNVDKKSKIEIYLDEY